MGEEKIRVAINGFGRVGRDVARIILEQSEIELVAINDLGSVNTLAHLLKYDSVHGTFEDTEVQGNEIVSKHSRIKVLAERDPEKLPWDYMRVDVVVESTGIFKNRKGASKHLKAGAKKVIITAPGKNPDATIVLGVNDKIYDPEEHKIISLASCTTNCLATIVKILNDAYGISSGLMTTVHAATGDQMLCDSMHDDLRRARSAVTSIIPTTTGAASALGDVIPEMKGKLDGMCLRVPTPDVSLVDLVVKTREKTTKEEVNEKLQLSAENEMKGVLGVSYEELVSMDYTNLRLSSMVDALSTNVTAGNLIKVIAWYDNEWGYSCRVVDMIKRIG